MVLKTVSITSEFADSAFLLVKVDYDETKAFIVLVSPLRRLYDDH